MAKRQPKEKAKTNPSTTAEYNRRINMVYEMLLSGLSRYEISVALEKQNIKVEYRQITNYIADATKLIDNYLIEDRDKIKSKFLSQYNMLFKKALMNKDFKTAVSIIEKQSKMLGVAEPKTDEGNDNTIEFIHKIVR